MSNEWRTVTEPLELRADDARHVAVGYAARFKALSQNLGGFVERIAPGAFTRTIEEQDVVALRDHDTSRLLGRKSAGTLRMSIDDQGLRYEIDLPDTTEGRDTRVLLERGDLIGSSFGFVVMDEDWGETDQGFPLRTLKQVSLRDVGPVTFPAYSSTSAAFERLARTRGIDHGDLVRAAEANELRSMIFDAGDGEPAARPAPVPPIHRPRRR